MLKPTLKRGTALMMALVLALSLAWGVVPAGAAGETEEDATPQITANPVDNSVSEDSYPMDKVNRDLLVSHTDKSSELKDGTPDYPKGNDAVNLSCNPELYHDLGWDPDTLASNAQGYAADESNQNPLAGFSFVTPDELMIGRVSLDSHYQTNIKTINDQAVADASGLDGDLGKLSTAVNDQNWTENDHDQTHNAVGVDIDGDGSDEYAYLTLFEGYKGSDWKGDSCLKVELFDVVNGSWAKLCEIGYDMDGSSNCYVNDIEAGPSKGYAVLEAGNFDHDAAGTEELAVYLPDREWDDSSWARVVILKYENNALDEVDSIKLNSILGDYGKLGDRWYLPTVSLSTSSLRLGEPVETKGAYHYEPYTDLVINVSMPKHYRNDGLNMNSSTTICQFGSDCKISNVKSFEYGPFSITSGGNTKNVRMTAVSSCEADLNGDGYKELVVGGIEESGLGSLSSTDYGSYSSDFSLVNIIYYTGSGYELVWDKPKEVEALGTLCPEGFDEVVSPVALCGGHFDPRTPSQQDQLCLQGVFLRCDGARITGPANYVNKSADDTVNYCIIVNTSPYKEKQNFPDSYVSFTNLNNGVNLPNAVGAVDDEAWISWCETGAFLSSAGTECVAMITSDKRDGEPNQIYMDVVVASINANGEVKYTGYNDILGGSRDEDDYGTCLFLCFLNCDDDAYYYRYTGTYSSWSAPVLFSVIQVPPYYREANSINAIQFDVSTGVSDTEQVNVSLGFQITYAGQVKIPLIGTFGTQSGFGANVGYSHAWSQSKTITNTIRLYADQDYALAYVVPVLVNTYDILMASQVNDPNAEPQYYEIREPLDPIFTALSVDQYNAALDNNTEHNDIQLPADYSAPRLTAEMLAKSRAGDPMAYENNVDEVIKAGPQSGDDCISMDEKKELLASDGGTAVNSQGPTMGSNLALGSSYTNTGSETGNVSLGYVIGAEVLGQSAKTTPVFTATAGFSCARTHSSTVKYTVLYQGISKTLPDGVEFDFGDDRYTDMKGDSRIFHYDPTAQSNALSYNYTATAVAYPLGNYKTDLNLLRGVNPEDMDPSFTIYELSYATSGYMTTPEPPLNFTVQRAALNTPEILGDVPEADGSADITLAWDSTVRNQDRAPYGYNIYMLNAQNASTGSKIVYLQNKEGPILRNPDGNYTNYTLHLEKNNYSDHCTFYIVPVFKETVNGQMQITEGILTGKLEINSLETLVWGAAVHFTKQPENVVLHNDDSTETAIFTAAAEKSSSLTDDMRFDWQTWDRTARKWTNVKRESLSGKTATSEYRLALSGEAKAAQIDVPVRCVVTCGNNSAQSALVACVYQQDPEIMVKDGYKIYDGKPADPPATRCTSDGDVTYTWFKDGTQLSGAPTNAGSYVCKAAVAETDAYLAGEASCTVTIAPVQPAVTLSAGQDGAAANVTATVSGLLEADGSVTFTVTKDGSSKVFDPVEVTKIGDSCQAVLSGDLVAGGQYTVKAVYTSASGNYLDAVSGETVFHKDLQQRTVTMTESFEKKAGDPSFRLQPAADKTAESPNEDVWSYAVTLDTWDGYDLAGTEAEPTVTVSDTGEVTVNHAGTAVIQVTLTDKAGVYDKATALVTVDVKPIPLTVASYAEPTEAAYGKQVTYGLTYTLEDGTALDSFTPDVGALSAVPVTGDASDTPYPVEIAQKEGKLTYNGTEYDVFLCRDYTLTMVNGTLTVMTRDLSDPKDVLVTKPADVIYNGTEQKQSVTVTAADGTALEEGKDYTLTYSGDPDLINPGTVTVTVTGIGNYQNYQTTEYRILEKQPDNNGGGSSGGGGAAASANPVTLPASSSGAASHGSVKASAANARAGDKVTLTLTPDEGYQVDKLTVTDAKGNVIEVTRNADGTYSFTMPDSRVEIAAVFAEIAAAAAGRFVDVAADAFYAEAVAWAVEHGVTTGTDETHFSPNAPCTRAHMVTFLWRAAGSPEPAGGSTPFRDVQAGSYYEKAVAWAVENGITNGVDETRFAPGDTVTRAQTVAFLFRYAKASAEASSSFADVSPEAWYAEAVAWAAEKGITNGVDATHFAPNDDCVRGQIVTFLYRLMAG